ncbi:hypothetical protein ES703_34085 [subsurface metagenome]
MIFPVPVHDDGDREELLQLLDDAHASAAGARRPVGAAEGLVEVEEAHVEARLPGSGHPHDRVGVSLVVAAEAADLVDHLRPLVYPGVEYPGVLGVRDEHTRRALRHRSLQRLRVGEPGLRVRVDGDQVESSCSWAGGVAGVAEYRGDDLVPLLQLPVDLVVLPHDQCVVVGRS